MPDEPANMDPRQDEVELALAAMAGDKAAFAVLATSQRPALLRLCRRVLRDRLWAEDAVQETMVRGLLGVGCLHQADRFGAWLNGIALNVCRRWLGDRLERSWSVEALEGGSLVLDQVCSELSPEDAAIAGEASQRIREALAGLPPGQRATATMFYLAEMSYQEIADGLGITVGAVRTRLYKGRASLRRQLRGIDQEDSIMEPEFVDMRVGDVRRRRADENASTFVAILEELDGDRHLVIGVGSYEGTNLAFTLENVELRRPLPYVFFLNTLAATGARLRAIKINRLVKNTFYAVVEIDGPLGRQAVDARPSDALNVAVLAGTPIQVASDVLSAVAESIEGGALVPPAKFYELYDEGAAEVAASPEPHRLGWLRGSGEERQTT